MLSPLKDVHEYFCHNKADEAAAWEGEDPGEHHILYDAKVDGRDPLHRSHAHDGAGLCVGGGHRDPEQAGIKKAESAGYVGGKALEEEADRLYIASMHSLHSEEKDVLAVIAWREIYSYLEKCADACEHAADVVESVVMKNS